VPRYIRDSNQRTRVLALFPAWQIEEILCVYEFAKDTYGGFFDQVAWDLDEERNPRYRHIDMTSVSEDLLLFRYPECCKLNSSNSLSSNINVLSRYQRRASRVHTPPWPIRLVCCVECYRPRRARRTYTTEYYISSRGSSGR
jgi:hypothetical protein